jgi:predicted RNA binding protein YcfA (HicA-like mRNA interferase family)
MTRLPPLKVRQVIRALERLGFELVRQKGSHALFHNQDCRRAPIPIHPTTDINPYFLSDVLKQLEINEDDFLRAVRRR